jgi:hypothetical protein
MAKIKLEDGNVVVYYSETSGSIYDAVKTYKIDLTNRKHFLVKNNETEEIEWILKDEELIMIENLTKEAWFYFENSHNVIYSYKKSGNIKQVEKCEKQLEKNKIILDFLKNYTIK